MVGRTQVALPTFQGAQKPNTTIFENLKTLAVSLDALTSITNSNLGSVQSTIEGADESFHVFAVIGDDGAVDYSDYDGNVGWNFSNGQNPGSSEGFYNTSRFASDDGTCGFRLNGNKVDGNSPGPSLYGSNGFGVANYDGGDGRSSYYWNGSSVSNSTYVGFVFTGDMQ